jgi:DNA repair protein RecN (Recombination protein N)
MLTRLYIRNYALLDEADILFSPGLNILTGETGAGKSILIGALGTILGDRADTLMVRSGETKAVVEAQFVVRNRTALIELLRAQDLDIDDDGLILRREIQESGRSRAFVNDSPAPLSVLEEIGDLLVDLHGQHEHQSLLRSREQMNYLDDFGGHGALLDRVHGLHARLLDLLKQRADLERRQQDLLARRDLYLFQADEIRRSNPLEGEEEELLKEEKILKNSARLSDTTAELYSSLYEQEGSVFEHLASAVQGFEELARIDSDFAKLEQDCQTAQVLVEEVSRALRGYADKLEFDPERLEGIRQRLATFSGLKKKYGPTMSEVLAHKARIEQELASFEGLDKELDSLKEGILEIRREFSKSCQELSEARHAAASRLREELPPLLEAMGIAGVQFDVELRHHSESDGLAEIDGRRYRASHLGIDEVEFLISTNPGMPLRPLAKIASGGEISRVMLALKSLVAAGDHIPVLIFDEIDIGISGRIAQSVGRQLRRLSKSHQVLCITHLPQIASMGNHHYLVEKVQARGSNRTEVRQLGGDERAMAIARLLGGEKISEVHLRSARQLLAEAESE